MVWLHARLVSAKMINLQSLGDKPDELLVRPPMRPYHFAADLKEAVPILIPGSLPLPAPRVGFPDVLVEAL